LARTIATVAALALVVQFGGNARTQGTVSPRDRTITTFLNELRRAVDQRDRRAVAELFQYPVTVLASGLRIPVPDSGSLIRMYDLFFTPEMRCVIDQSGFPQTGPAPPKYPIQASTDGLSLGGGAVWAERNGTGFKITRMMVPASSPIRSARHAQRRVVFSSARYPAQFSGTLIRNEEESYLVSARRGQILEARIEGFARRDAVIHVVDRKTGAFVDSRSRDGARTWTGMLPQTAEYRIDVVRLAPYCDPPLTYVLAVTLR
jgi:hypothetical protein